MSDYSRDVTDEAIRLLSKDIEREYAKASREMKDKLDDYLKRFAKKDKKWQEWVASGKKTQAQYNLWRRQQMLVGRNWESMKNDLAEVCKNADKVAYDYIKTGKAEVFAFSANYATYQIEKAVGVSTNFTQYNPDAVLRIMNKNPKMLPPPGKKLSQRIREGKAKRWRKKTIQSVATQSILQGESVPNIAKRLSKAVETSSAKAAIRDARTMINGAENAGRYDSYERARRLGLMMVDYWSAVHDSRTRTSHRHMDGEKRGENGLFSNDLEYPCDPSGDASEVYNCRCRLDSVLEGMTPDFEDRYMRHDKAEDISNMSWDEWKEATPVSRSITHQRDVGNYYKSKYIKEYREG